MDHRDGATTPLASEALAEPQVRTVAAPRMRPSHRASKRPQAIATPASGERAWRDICVSAGGCPSDDFE
ncbi:MAG TPA: hypothetical protein VFD92_05085 [Candidatus Binatia bacterium]|nr:hypothetical protein [Candidatus Binatia bacterium]